MTAQTTWRPWCSLDVLYLGEIPVGRVSQDFGDRARWLFDLDGHRAFWRAAKTPEQARAAVEAKLADWLQQAGLAE